MAKILSEKELNQLLNKLHISQDELILDEIPNRIYSFNDKNDTISSNTTITLEKVNNS